MSSAGNSRRRGVTLIEMLVVVAILGVMTAIAYPSMTAGLDTLRVNAACDEIASALNAAVTHAERRSETVEIHAGGHRFEIIAPSLRRRVALGEIECEERTLFIEPGGVAPGAPLIVRGPRGAIKSVRVDPITRVAEVRDAR